MGRGAHPKLRIAILPWPWFRFCKVMLWRKVSGIYQESWYNFATTIDAMKRLAPPHLPPSSTLLLAALSPPRGKGNPCCRYPFTSGTSNDCPRFSCPPIDRERSFENELDSWIITIVIVLSYYVERINYHFTFHAFKQLEITIETPPRIKQLTVARLSKGEAGVEEES